MVVTNWQGMDNARREVIIARDSECLETADIVEGLEAADLVGRPKAKRSAAQRQQ